MPTTRRTFLNTMAAGLLAGRCDMWPTWKSRTTIDRYMPADELGALSQASAWINTPALDPGKLEGKVVLVQFWTFTCINWLRTLPYVRAWSKHYADAGLVVVGVHTPEFGFERTLSTVERATPQLNVAYPVAVDTEYRIWRAFDNHYWPALYLFDAHGRLQYRHFGEGEYDQTERMIRRLVRDAGTVPDDEAIVPDGAGAEAAPDWSNLRSPENYLGLARTSGFSPPGGIVPEVPISYSLPRHLRLNQWSLEGEWTVEQEYITAGRANSRLLTCFHGRDLHLVMGPRPGASPVRFRVTLDGAVPGAAHGFDIDAQGDGIAREQRLYQLIRQPVPIADRVMQIEFLDPGIEAYAFTFG